MAQEKRNVCIVMVPGGTAVIRISHARNARVLENNGVGNAEELGKANQTALNRRRHRGR